MNDIIINKVQSIQRCIKRAKEEYFQDENSFKEDYTRQDAAILNITRACEQAIDLANHVVKKKKLGIPTGSAQTFDLLAKAGIISENIKKRLVKMIGFLNTAVHEYQELNIDIVIAIIQEDLKDLVSFTDAILSIAEGPSSE